MRAHVIFLLTYQITAFFNLISCEVPKYMALDRGFDKHLLNWCLLLCPLTCTCLLFPPMNKVYMWAQGIFFFPPYMHLYLLNLYLSPMEDFIALSTQHTHTSSLPWLGRSWFSDGHAYDTGFPKSRRVHHRFWPHDECWTSPAATLPIIGCKTPSAILMSCW